MFTSSKTIFIMIFLLTLISCQYSRPLVSNRIRLKTEYYKYINDTLIEKTRKEYLFLTIRKYGLLGNYAIQREYNKNGTLVKETRIKMIPFKITEIPINQKIFKKEILYSENGEIVQLNFEKVKTKKGSGKVIVLDKREIKFDSLCHKIN